MTLRERCVAEAQRLLAQTRKNQEREIADTIEVVARDLAQDAIRSMYEISDNDQIGSDGERSRGSYAIRRELAGDPCVEKRWYRKELEEKIAATINAVTKGKP